MGNNVKLIESLLLHSRYLPLKIAWLIYGLRTPFVSWIVSIHWNSYYYSRASVHLIIHIGGQIYGSCFADTHCTYLSKVALEYAPVLLLWAA